MRRSGFQTALPALPDGGAAAEGSPAPCSSVQLMCLLASMTNHSCAGDSMRYESTWLPAAAAPQTVEPGLRFIAVRDIAAGEELTHPYVDPGADVEDRRARLQVGYGFLCDCSRCVEEAEAEGRSGDGEGIMARPIWAAPNAQRRWPADD